MRFNDTRFGTGFWVLVSVLLTGSVTCFSVAAHAASRDTLTYEVVDSAKASASLTRQGVMTERLRAR